MRPGPCAAVVSTRRRRLRARKKVGDAFVQQGQGIGSFAAGTAVQSWRLQIDGGLPGKATDFPKLADRRIDVQVRVKRSDSTAQT